MEAKVDVEHFAMKVVEIMKQYGEAVCDQLNDELNSVSKEAVKRIKADSPSKTGEYAKGWTRKVNRKNSIDEYTIYNKKKPQLTHLLEKGHEVRPEPTSQGKKDFVKGRTHISTAEEWAREELVRRVANKL